MTSSSLLFNPVVSIPPDSPVAYRSTSLVESNIRDKKGINGAMNSDLLNTFSSPMLFRHPVMVSDMGLPLGDSPYLQSPLQPEPYSIPPSDVYGSLKTAPSNLETFEWNPFFSQKRSDSSAFLAPPPSFLHSWENPLADTTSPSSAPIPIYPPSLTHSPASMSSLSSASLSPSPTTSPELPGSPLPRRNSNSSTRSKEGEGQKSCSHCGATSTPLWRREPVTLRSLCNACGLYLQQRHKLRPKELIEADAAENQEEEYDPSYTGPECSHCHTRNTSVWRRSKTGAQLCNACGVYQRLRGKDRPLSLRRNRIKPRSKHTSK